MTFLLEGNELLLNLGETVDMCQKSIEECFGFSFSKLFAYDPRFQDTKLEDGVSQFVCLFEAGSQTYDREHLP